VFVVTYDKNLDIVKCSVCLSKEKSSFPRRKFRTEMRLRLSGSKSVSQPSNCGYSLPFFKERKGEIQGDQKQIFKTSSCSMLTFFSKTVPFVLLVLTVDIVYLEKSFLGDTVYINRACQHADI